MGRLDLVHVSSWNCGWPEPALWLASKVGLVGDVGHVARDEPDLRSAPMILLVDDDDTVRETSADMLQELGYSVMQASSGSEALALLDTHRNVDIMVTDIRMPGMSGLELSDLASNRFGQLKIILMSGYFLPQPITRRFLQKPFRTRDLDDAIRAELAPMGNA